MFLGAFLDFTAHVHAVRKLKRIELQALALGEPVVLRCVVACVFLLMPLHQQPATATATADRLSGLARLPPAFVEASNIAYGQPVVIEVLAPAGGPSK